MTDFENAAFAVFVVLLSRAILSLHLNFYVPISKVDENMARAQKRAASTSNTFYFRKDVFATRSSASSVASSSGASSPVDGSPKKKPKKMGNCFPPIPLPENGFVNRNVEEEYEEMTMNEIMNGKNSDFPGLLPLVNAYLDSLDIEPRELQKIQQYLDLVKRRANGTLLTPATWIRNFVTSHPDYKKDSVVSQIINYDLLKAIDEIEQGVRQAPDLLPVDYKGGKQDSGSL